MSFQEIYEEREGKPYDKEDVEGLEKFAEDLHNRLLKAEDRWQKAADKEALEVHEGIRAAKIQAEALSKKLKSDSEAYEDLIKEQRKSIADLSAQVQSLQEQLKHSQEVFFEVQQKFLKALFFPLSRPVGLLEIVGEANYATLKDLYLECGGDAEQIPAPPPPQRL